MGLESHKKSNKTDGIVVGGAKKTPTVQAVKTDHTTSYHKRVKLLGIAVVTGIVIGIGAWFIYDTTVNVTVYDIPEMGSEGTSQPAKDETPFVEPAVEAAAIQKQIEQYPGSNLSARQKLELANLYSALGAAYSNDGQGDQAIEAYETADTYASKEQKRAILGGLAYAYAAKGESQKAIDAFEELIDLIQAKPDPFTKRDIAGYQREIEKLKNGEML